MAPPCYARNTYARAEEEYDPITIEGVPSIPMKTAPCVHRDFGNRGYDRQFHSQVIMPSQDLVTIPSAVLKDMRKFIHK